MDLTSPRARIHPLLLFLNLLVLAPLILFFFTEKSNQRVRSQSHLPPCPPGHQNSPSSTNSTSHVKCLTSKKPFTVRDLQHLPSSFLKDLNPPFSPQLRHLPKSQDPMIHTRTLFCHISSACRKKKKKKSASDDGTRARYAPAST
jgi:hypothetical protein